MLILLVKKKYMKKYWNVKLIQWSCLVKSLIKICKNYKASSISILIKMMPTERVLMHKRNKFGLKK